LSLRDRGAHDGAMAELGRISRGNRGQSDPVRVIARHHEGIVERAQLLAAGISRWAIDRALRSGALYLVHPGVYSTVAPELLTEDGVLIAAVMAAGEGALLSHATAAWRWGIIPAPPMRIELAVPRRRAAPEGLTLFRSHRLRPADITTTAPFRTTSVPRTLLDLATTYTHHALLRALAEAEFHHDLRPADIERALRRGHPGSANLRKALASHTPSRGTVRSNLERRFRRVLIRHGIELPLRNQRLGPYTVDCLWPKQRVVVELDGRQHDRPHQADEDDGRDLWLRANRYVARRYGQRQIDDQEEAVRDDLLSAFAEAVALGFAPAAAYAAAGVPLKL
jgi:very-short-patch-repair endonuclease